MIKRYFVDGYPQDLAPRVAETLSSQGKEVKEWTQALQTQYEQQHRGTTQADPRATAQQRRTPSQRGDQRPQQTENEGGKS